MYARDYTLSLSMVVALLSVLEQRVESALYHESTDLRADSSRTGHTRPRIFGSWCLYSSIDVERVCSVPQNS